MVLQCLSLSSVTAHECQSGSKFNDIQVIFHAIHRIINCPPVAVSGMR